MSIVCVMKSNINGNYYTVTLQRNFIDFLNENHDHCMYVGDATAVFIIRLV